MLSVNNFIKLFTLLSILLSLNLFADNRPMPICSNLRALILYDISHDMRNQCQKYGVNLELKSIKNALKSDINNDSDLSSSSCNMQCLKLASFANKNMEQCVNSSLTKPYVDGFNNSMTYKWLTNKQACLKMKKQL